jgi:hypothetical protein
MIGADATTRSVALIFFAIALSVSLGGCDQHKSANSDPQNTTSSAGGNGDDTRSHDDSDESSDSGDGSNEDSAQAAAVESLENESYEDVRGTDDCTEDCSGHEAGWEWAKQHEIFDESECSGDSDSFIEGCQAYAEEVQSRTDSPD